MKTIEVASLENSKKHYIMAFSEDLHKDADMDFRAGVDFAQRWIPVEEELPEIEIEILLKNEKWITECNPYGVRIGFYERWDLDDIFINAKWGKDDCYIEDDEKPTHWRPIELK